MTLRSRHIVPVVLVVFVLGIGATMIFNLWQTSSSKIPAAYDSGEFAGQYNPADIRGSYSFGDIEEAFGVPAADLAFAFGVAERENPAAFLAKSLEDLYGEVEEGEIGTDAVRWFVALYTGLPYTPEEDTLLPSPALTLLEQRLDEAQLEAVAARIAAARIVDLDAGGGTEAGAGGAGTAEAASTGAETAAPSGPAETASIGAETGESSTHSESEAGEVRGKTTFGELDSWGVNRQTIEQILGRPAGNAGQSVRDYCIENGIEFSSVKDALQTAVDRALER